MKRAGPRRALLARLAPPEGSLTVVLVVLLCWTTLHSISSAGWGEAVEAAPWLAAAGALVGYVSARSRLRMLPALTVGALIGVELLWILLALRAPGENWQMRLVGLATDLVTWTVQSFNSGATHQPTVFAIAIGWVGWTIGFFSSWLVFRLQHAWWAVVANGAVGIIHLSYAPTNQLPAFLLSVMLGVLLVASLDVHLRRSVWQSYGLPIGFPETLATLVLGAGIAGVALLVAWHLPAVSASEDVSASWRESWGPFNKAQQQVDRLFGGSRQQSRPASGLRFSAELAPRSSFDLGAAPVFSAAAPGPTYWRAMTYDRYDGTTMASTTAVERLFRAGSIISGDTDTSPRRTLAEQRITVLADQSTTLFAADAPRAVSRDVQVSSRQSPWDLVQGQFLTPLQRGDSYRVLSSILRATPDELRLAGRSTAPWLAPYLALPAELPARVRTLAAETASGASNDYDRAAALESYLRDLTYSTHVPTPPPGRDWVDYLVFDSQVGYCDYFATALAVMARSIGLPARVASGFAPGMLDQAENTYLVRESEAHSWTEIYFAGYGWITFEPSAIRARPERGAALGPTPEPEPVPGSAPSVVEEQAPFPDEVLDRPVAERFEGSSMTATGAILLIVACLLLVAGAALGAASYAWRRRLAGLQPRQRDYGELLNIAALGRVGVESSMTPSEIADRMAEQFPYDADVIHAVSRAYVEAAYGQSLGEPAPGDEGWERRRPRLVREALRRRLARRGRS